MSRRYRWSPLLGLAAIALSAAVGAQTTDRPVLSPLPATSSVKTAAQAGTLLRRLYFLADYYDADAIGDSLVRRFPRDNRLRAWHVANLTQSNRIAIADSLTARADTASRDPWILFARALALSARITGFGARREKEQVLRLSARGFSLSPRDPDMAWLYLRVRRYLYNHEAAIVAFVDSVAPRLGNPTELLVEKAMAQHVLSYSGRTPDPPKREEAWRTFAAARAADTSNFSAIFAAVQTFDGEHAHDDDVRALAARAVARSPRSPAVRSEYWGLLSGQKAVVDANRREFLTLTDSAPWALRAVAAAMRRDALPKGDFTAVEDRVLAKAPRSPEAEAILLARAQQWGDSLRSASDTTVKGTKPDSIVMRQRYREALESFINRPWRASPGLMNSAAGSLFLNVRDDTTYPADKLLRVVTLLRETECPDGYTVSHTMAARTLAERKIDFRFAERLAREGERLAVEVIGDYPANIIAAIGDQAEAIDAAKASLRDALGWVFFNEGKLAEADTELQRAVDLSKRNAEIYYHVGRLRMAQGRESDAELAYAQGLTIRYRGTNPNRKELEKLYVGHHGNMDGWASYVAALEEKERATRKARILETQGKDSKDTPAFRLVDLAGDTLASSALRGKSAVVNFWGTWCGPCVAEMPELQQFYEKYRADSSVAILTISNDKSFEELKVWMTKRKLTIPTLFDDGYVTRVGITGWPTTWFIDKSGRVQFIAVGNSGALVEEWSWRLEALRGRPIP